MPSSSSSSSGSSSPPPGSEDAPVKPNLKRKQPIPQAIGVTSDSDTSSSEDSSSDSQPDENVDNEATGEDGPVLSHAEKRRQKKKEQKPAKTAKPGENNKGQVNIKNTAEITPSKIPKRQNSVWVGNLAFKTTPESLQKFFDGVGEITRVHMPMKLTTMNKSVIKENRGFAYVDFATPDAKVLAITLSENHLDGRRLLIKDGDDYSGRPSTSNAPGIKGTGETTAALKPSGLTKTSQKILRSQKQPAGPTLFLGNLGFETTEKSIRDMLTNHRVKDHEGGATEGDSENKGKDPWIRKIRMGTFEDSGKCKGWAFVDFTNTEHATAALTNPKNYFLDGRKLVVEFASPEAVRRGGGPRGEKTSKGTEAETEKDGQAQTRSRGERTRPKKRTSAPSDADAADPGRPAKKPKVEGQLEEQRPRIRRSEKDEKSRFRAKPGAALANAKRETAAIVPSQGKKIVFS